MPHQPHVHGCSQSFVFRDPASVGSQERSSLQLAGPEKRSTTFIWATDKSNTLKYPRNINKLQFLEFMKSYPTTSSTIPWQSWFMISFRPNPSEWWLQIDFPPLHPLGIASYCASPIVGILPHASRRRETTQREKLRHLVPSKEKEKINKSTKKMDHSKRKATFQPSLFRGFGP